MVVVFDMLFGRSGNWNESLGGGNCWLRGGFCGVMFCLGLGEGCIFVFWLF